MNHKIIIIMAIAVIIIAIAFGAFWAVRTFSDKDFSPIIFDKTINSFEECIAAGYPALESYPRQCNTPDGKHFVEEIKGDILMPDEENGIGLANPASVYCEDWDGEVEIRHFLDGDKGFCLFDDGSECEEWAYYRDDCWEGEVFCKDFCGDGICQEIVCEAVGCPCAENKSGCPADCK